MKNKSNAVIFYVILLFLIVSWSMIFSFASLVFGEDKLRVKFDYAIVQNPYLPKEVAVRAVRNAISEINSDKIVRVGIGKRSTPVDPFYGKRTYTAAGGGFYMFHTFFTSYYFNYLRSLVSGRTMMLIDPPIAIDGGLYVGGFAWLGGFFDGRSFSYCNGIQYNDRGVSYVRLLTQCMRHEFYHLMCAQHDSSNANIMHPNAGGNGGNGSKLPLNEKTRKEILRCVSERAR